MLFILLMSIGGQSILAQITGLSEYEIFLDPGHSQTENMGLYNYSESEKVLQVALELKAMFEQQTDIRKVHMCRLTDEDVISLTARTDLANSLGADFYYSIHSDAGSPSANSTLTMYGGYNNEGVTLEKMPQGGKAYGAILCADLTGVMRTITRGNYADRVYYDGNLTTHSTQTPWLHVNRTTNMASLLSEAGFHTNPTQQQLNMNAEWKKMEALSAFRSFLQYKGLVCPEIGILAGIITDADTGMPINGASVSADNKNYITDTFESLFNKYSNDPEELRNGFYFIDGFQPGKMLDVSVEADGYVSHQEAISLTSAIEGSTADNISFLDVALTSTKPAKVVEAIASEGELSSLMPGHDIIVSFSRKMEQASVESAIAISPEVPISAKWQDEFTLLINTEQLNFETAYVLSLDGGVAKNALTQQLLDGDADGTEGGIYELAIKTSPNDVDAPVIIQCWPEENQMVEEVRPVIRVVFNERIDAANLPKEALSVVNTVSGQVISGSLEANEYDGQAILHFFPAEDLVDNESYKVVVAPGVSDIYGNEILGKEIVFNVEENEIISETVIDGFDNGIAPWWQPQASGSTSGIVTEQTNTVHEQQTVVKFNQLEGSLRLNYGWLNPGSGYIRHYLPPSSQQNTNRFSSKHVLQMYVFGDASNNKFRFMLKDGNSTYEASDWYVIDWLGWKLISWDLREGKSVAWVNGDGVLDGEGFYLDGIHLTSSAEGKKLGTIYYDDLKFVEYRNVVTSSGAERQQVIDVYPNPVRDILFLEANSVIEKVSVFGVDGRLLLNKVLGAKSGSFSVVSLPTGYYIVHITTSEGVEVRKIKVVI